MNGTVGPGGQGTVVSCASCGKLYRVDPARVPAGMAAFECKGCWSSVPLQPPSPLRRGEEPARILLALGEPELIALVLGILHRGGIAGTVAHTGEQAAAILAREEYSALFLSVVLPDMLGYELIDRARSVNGGDRLPILLLSSLYRNTRYKRAPTSLYGADDYIELHHLPEFLLPKLLGFVERGRAVAPARPGTGVPPLPTSAEREEGRRVEQAAPERRVEGESQQALAQRMARIIVGDIALYNEGLIAGRMPKDALEALRRDLDEGRRLMAERFPGMAEEAQGFLAQEMKRFLGGRLRGGGKGGEHGSF